MHEGYEIDIISTREGLQALLPHWQEFLAGRVQGSHFNNDPRHIELCWDAGPEVTPWIVALRRGGQLRCIAAFYADGTRFKVKFSVLTLASLPPRMLKVFGDRFIIADDEDAEACFATVFETVRKRYPRLGLIYFENLNATSPLWQFCRGDGLRRCRYRMYWRCRKWRRCTGFSFRRRTRSICQACGPRRDLICGAERGCCATSSTRG